jgi:hypothetical protein
MPETPVSGAAVVLTGPLTPRAVGNSCSGAGSSWYGGLQRPLASDLGERLDQLAAHAAAVVILSNRDSATRAQRLAASLEPRLTPDFRDDSLGAPCGAVRR